MAVSRTWIARLTVDGSPYPLESGMLLRVVRGDGCTEWQVSASCPPMSDLDLAAPHRLLTIAGGRAFSGTAWLHDEPAMMGRLRYRFVGSGPLETPS